MSSVGLFAIISVMKKFVLFFILMLGGCAARNPLVDFRFQTQMVPPYVVASWYRLTEPGKTVKIYIEGDGALVDAEGHSADNPTPNSTFVREIAAQDDSPNVAYLARPCQYLQVGACRETDWTTGRFSPAVIASMEQAVLNLIKKAGAKQAILIGYAGGAQIAGLVAVRHPEYIRKVITIAGVLDQEAWVAYQEKAPLTDSLNLKDVDTLFADIPQIHYVGEQDKVVPPALTEAFVSDPTTVVVVPKATHTKGFQSIYPAIYQER